MALNKIEVPQVSTPHGNCRECKFWGREFSREMLMTREGQMMPADALKAQVAASFKIGERPLTADQIAIATADTAPCWRHPQWQMQPDNHYCGDFTPEDQQ